MSPDNIDSLIVSCTEWLEKMQPVDFDDDVVYDRWTSIFYNELEKFCTRDRNYN